MKKDLTLTSRDWNFYNLLCDEPFIWHNKEEIAATVPGFTLHETTHDKCSSMNLTRIKLNKARALGLISHYILLEDDKFKVATSEEEIAKELKKQEKQMWTLYIRYLETKGIIKENHQGKLLNCRGEVIDEQSLAKRFHEPFNYND